MKKIILIIALLVLGIAISSPNTFKNLDNLFKLPSNNNTQSIKLPEPDTADRLVTSEESVTTRVVSESLPSVVTIGISTTRNNNTFEIDPFNPFNPFRQSPNSTRKIEQNIGSGFIISEDGLIITNKHVVSETEATYKVITNDKKTFNVDKIYRDPLNDLAILKINTSGLKPLALGDSSKIKLGQQAIAIGTPLGDFTNTVTVGIISGLGRGITAGSPLEGFVEKLDNVIQTDAAINPGNSGGPLLNSSGQVVGINTAVAGEGQNIGFAIPSNVVRDLIQNFNQRGGNFERPFIGVRYKILDKQTAVLNELVEGAYIIEVVADSPAAQAGLQEEDIIIEFDGKKVNGEDDQSLAKAILEKRIGDRVTIRYWRNKEIKSSTLILKGSE
ncbi:MAG TPA: trypsin-like peptidase domain-containing protein [Candidatus Nitrosocosmicus sp.]|nr:trypsin-like peptidase domain-containing protein [Candidatus Nitrosocosmicus sp.]